MDTAASSPPVRLDPASVDDGWDDTPSAAAAQPIESRAPAPSRARSEAEPTTAWGDDSDAPTPDIALPADLPPDPPADDPDPTSYEGPELQESGKRAALPAVCNPIGVKFAPAGKIYLFDAGDDDYKVGEQVIVAGERGNRLGTVAVAAVRQPIEHGPLKRVVRRPNARDRERLAQHEQQGQDILRRARDIARHMKIPAKLFRADLGLSGGKVQIYLSGEEKIDTRRLAQELSQKLDVRVDLRQTGVRDEAKMVGGIGSCGQELCCSTWLPSFVPVSIKNAKDQGLVLNPTKVSGQCGRLKCCLVYEQETYAAMRKGLPKLGKRVVTEAGEGRVVEVDVLHQRVRVSLVQGEVQVFAAADVKPLFASQPQRKGRPGGRRGSPTDDGPPSDA